MTENIEEPGQVGYRPPQDQKQEQLHRDGKPGDGDKRESVYDMNSYEISVWQNAKPSETKSKKKSILKQSKHDRHNHA